MEPNNLNLYNFFKSVLQCRSNDKRSQSHLGEGFPSYHKHRLECVSPVIGVHAHLLTHFHSFTIEFHIFLSSCAGVTINDLGLI